MAKFIAPISGELEEQYGSVWEQLTRLLSVGGNENIGQTLASFIYPRTLEEALTSSLPGVAMPRFKVGIAKDYFPKEIRPSGPGNAFQDIVNIIAKNRPEAAQKVWTKHGERWLEMMGPKETTKRTVKLHVDDPDSRKFLQGALGRLVPEKVFTE